MYLEKVWICGGVATEKSGCVEVDLWICLAKKWICGYVTTEGSGDVMVGKSGYVVDMFGGFGEK